MRKLGVMVVATTVVVATVGWSESPVGTVEVVGTQLRFTASDGVDNHVEILFAGAGKVQVRETAGPIVAASKECVAVIGAVTCDVTGVSSYRLDGGDQGDVLSVRDPMSVQLAGGSGDDTLTGNGAADVLDGGTGNDILDGGGGNDVLIGGLGADVINGAVGLDIAGYQDHVLGVHADADGQQGDDGAAGEGDTIDPSVENLAGGAGADVLVGSPAPNSLFGGPGADVLFGGAGFDHLDGGTGPSSSVENDACNRGPDGAATWNCEIVR